MLKTTQSKWLTLSTAAVGAIYAAGFFYTEPTVQALNPQILDQKNASESNKVFHQMGKEHHETRSFHKALSSTTTSANHQTSNSDKSQHKSDSSSLYKDGIYQGVGTNTYGSVGVSVTIQNGKITQVQITQCTTHYPQSVIDPVLPNEVEAKQTWQIDIVSGATASTQDFAMAVYQALQAAKA
ncbi:FMN-binding protein [Alicyclobacillus tolerans]|uniref:FMN-binding domain-containing protein n=1 Tax=Alicyclobacillus tolerans TaxID=90970 RepID=A0A1M6JTP8_9BACL|nr:FMN-binding protein [Alicyclobacillus montanus]SHJ49980.1 FMN-binding domain-containing protein [Alicyclobacillus montanus]